MQIEAVAILFIIFGVHMNVLSLPKWRFSFFLDDPIGPPGYGDYWI